MEINWNQWKINGNWMEQSRGLADHMKNIGTSTDIHRRNFFGNPRGCGPRRKSHELQRLAAETQQWKENQRKVFELNTWRGIQRSFTGMMKTGWTKISPSCGSRHWRAGAGDSDTPPALAGRAGRPDWDYPACPRSQGRGNQMETNLETNRKLIGNPIGN